MKNKLTRMVAILLALVMVIGVMSGCGNSGGKGEKTSNGNKVLFSYDGTDVTLKKAWIYGKMTAAQYESYYTSYFGENFWTMDMGTDDEGNATTFEDYVKEQVVTQIKQVIVLNNKAEEVECSLTDEDKEQCAEYAKAFAEDESGKAILAECGATEEDMQEIYEENALASKVQEYMIKDTDTNVSDDEARKTTISRVVFATTKTDDDGNTVDMTDDEKAQVLATAQAAQEELKAGKSIADIAEAQEYTNIDETFAAGESEEGEAFEKMLAGMKDGDITQEVQECDNGYVIAQLTAYTDADATAENKETIIAERQQEKFKEVYDEWTKDLEAEWSYKEDVDQELWAELVLRSEDSTATEAAEETTAAEGATEATEAAAEATTAAQ
ncbi:MAG: hypothetical protein SPI87_05040 [Anaerobutyricum sp.]|nr:hypothetical protein [Eubacterium sp.]MDY6046371.1 hypothetical protein [Anaerobutyricum sp.]